MVRAVFCLGIWGATLAAQSLPSQYADIPGARIHYIDGGGKGEPVVMLHAATGSTLVWEHQIPPFQRAGYRFISYDRRGWGKTEVLPNSPVGTASDDLAALMDKLGIAKFHLVGMAGGGFVALDFALSYPQRLHTLVLATTVTTIQDADYQKLMTSLRPPQFNALPPEVRELGPAYRAANPAGAERWVALEKQARPESLRALTQPMKSRATMAALEQIRLPTLVLAGGADLFAPPPLMRRVADRIKGAEFVSLPDSGHSAFWEQPEAFNSAILRFLRKHRSK